jgi:hypothetical protein
VEWDNLTQFFSNNEAFECLDVLDSLEDDKRSHGAMASALRRFDSLKEFNLINDDID